jgi:hypothetical protein
MTVWEYMASPFTKIGITIIILPQFPVKEHPEKDFILAIRGEYVY